MSATDGERTTERRLAAAGELDLLSTAAALDLFQAEDRRAVEAVEAVRDELAVVIDATAERLRRGGRLFYVGAGTSGRLGVLDASEWPPTFQTEPELAQGLIAGGRDALTRAVEGAEDDAAAGREALQAKAVGPGDVVLGISAGGTAPFVLAALEEARAREALDVLLTCVTAEEVPSEATSTLRVVCGPEVLAGSTRLKAGTVTKLVLNRLSTLVAVRLGKVHGNLMVDLDTRANAKLRARGLRILETLTGLAGSEAEALLDAAGGRVKRAAVMHARGCSPEEAEAQLEASGGSLRAAL